MSEAVVVGSGECGNPSKDLQNLAEVETSLGRLGAPCSGGVAIRSLKTTLPIDLSIKSGRNARAAIAEYWVVDVNARRIGVHRDPEAGKYKSVTAFSDNEELPPLTALSEALEVKSILPA